MGGWCRQSCSNSSEEGSRNLRLAVSFEKTKYKRHADSGMNFCLQSDSAYIGFVYRIARKF